MRVYKDKHMKRKLTESDVKKVNNFAANTTSLKQIDEEMEQSSCCSSQPKDDEQSDLEEIREVDDDLKSEHIHKDPTKSVIADGGTTEFNRGEEISEMGRQDSHHHHHEHQHEHEHKMKEITEEEKEKLHLLKKNLKNVFKQNRTGSIT